MTFNPNDQACGAFRSMFGDSAEMSPVGGYAGNSHFGFVNPVNVNAINPGWHVTTEVPGIGAGMPIRIHDFVKDSF